MAENVALNGDALDTGGVGVGPGTLGGFEKTEAPALASSSETGSTVVDLVGT